MKIPFLPILMISGFISTASVSAQQGPASSANEKVNSDPERIKKLKAINLAFSNLKQADRDKYYKLKKEAFDFFGNRRSFEALMTIYKMMEIFDKDPQVYTLLGSIEMKFRNFDNARTYYLKTKELSNSDNILRFSMAEIEFCTNNWKKSLEKFLELKKQFNNKANNNLVQLVDLKIVLCHLAMSKTTKEQVKEKHLEDAKALAGEASHLQDSPYYYYSKAALAFYANDQDTAHQFLKSVRTVYSTTPQILSEWDDTFIEFGYMTPHNKKGDAPISVDTIPMK